MLYLHPTRKKSVHTCARPAFAKGELPYGPRDEEAFASACGLRAGLGCGRANTESDDDCAAVFAAALAFGRGAASGLAGVLGIDERRARISAPPDLKAGMWAVRARLTAFVNQQRKAHCLSSTAEIGSACALAEFREEGGRDAGAVTVTGEGEGLSSAAEIGSAGALAEIREEGGRGGSAVAVTGEGRCPPSASMCGGTGRKGTPDPAGPDAESLLAALPAGKSVPEPSEWNAHTDTTPNMPTTRRTSRIGLLGLQKAAMVLHGDAEARHIHGYPREVRTKDRDVPGRPPS